MLIKHFSDIFYIYKETLIFPYFYFLLCCIEKKAVFVKVDGLIASNW